MCGWRGIGSKGAVQHGADWRAVSVHELDCVRCAQSGGVQPCTGGVVGCYAGSFPKGTHLPHTRDASHRGHHVPQGAVSTPM